MAVGERLTRFERVVVARPAAVPPREGGGTARPTAPGSSGFPCRSLLGPHAASWPLRTAFTVAGYHRLPPCAVGTPSVLSAAAILPKLTPDARSVTMRATTSAGNVDGHRAERRRPSSPPAPPWCAGGSGRVRPPRSRPASGPLGDRSRSSVGVDVGDVERPAFIGGGLHQVHGIPETA